MRGYFGAIHQIELSYNNDAGGGDGDDDGDGDGDGDGLPAKMVLKMVPPTFEGLYFSVLYGVPREAIFYSNVPNSGMVFIVLMYTMPRAQ